MSRQPQTAAPAQSGGLEPFVQQYQPDPDATRPGAEFLRYAQQYAPASLVQLWDRHGLGFYGGQRLAVVDPGEWMHVLQVWLGEDVQSYPIAVTSFGHVYHLDADPDSERVQCLDPHFQTNTVVARDLDEFFNVHLLGSDSHIADLEGPRGGARSKLGKLEEDEIYAFDPILALGGSVSPDSLVKREGPDHLVEIYQKVILR